MCAIQTDNTVMPQGILDGARTTNFVPFRSLKKQKTTTTTKLCILGSFAGEPFVSAAVAVVQFAQQ